MFSSCKARTSRGCYIYNFFILFNLFLYKIHWCLKMSELSAFFAVLLILTSLLVVLLERKFLAYAQRRLGPSIMGRNGAFQIALDLGKLLTKEVFLVPRPSSALAPIFLVLYYAIQLMFVHNFTISPSLYIFENVDALLFHHLILVMLSNILLIVLGLVSQSRYATIGSLRAVVQVISLDVFATAVYVLVVFSSQSANMHDFSIAQEQFWYAFIFLPAAAGFLIILLLEAKRTPFDHIETESEVVAGYQVEYSGPMLLIFFLAEYLHLIIASVHVILCFLGGWSFLYPFFFLPPIFFVPHATDIYLYTFNYLL